MAKGLSLMEAIFKDQPSRKLNKGQILIYEGDVVTNIYFLIQGYVKVSSINVNGSPKTIIIYAPGETFPLVSFLSGQGITAYSYECMTEVELKVMPHQLFQKIIKGNLELGEQLISYAYQMSLQFAERIEMLSAQNARHKIAALLNYLAAKTGVVSNSKTRLSLPLTSQEIADMCGLTRETASVQLQKLKKEGIISGRRYLTIDDRRLAEVTGG